ncbi:unnamed protein product [Rhodiola kirilowii]
MDGYCKKSGQIPAFGNWDYANDLPITQYFESARQAGLLRYTYSDDSAEFKKPPHTATRPKQKWQNPRVATTDQTRHRNKSGELSARKTKEQNDCVYKRKVKIVNILAKPVDEDLYKIPPELLRTSKTKKMLDLLKRCLTPSCCLA